MLHINNLVKRFDSAVAVQDLAFDVKQGEILALLGPNGAGKTTTLRMITGIIQPDSGSITFASPFSGNRQVDISRIGYLPEERGLYTDMPIIKTLIYLGTLRGLERQDAKEKAISWLDRFSLKDRALEKLSSLSKGNQQKVQFISSILHEPILAILDEPFSGFDPINQELFSKVIRELRDNGMTILISAHHLQLIQRIADRIVLLRKGQAVMSGSWEEIQKNAHQQRKLMVHFEQPPKSEAFSKHLVDYTAKITDNSAEILLPSTGSMDELLSNLPKIGSVASLSMEQASLHEIFVDTFSKVEEDAS